MVFFSEPTTVCLLLLPVVVVIVVVVRVSRLKMSSPRPQQEMEVDEEETAPRSVMASSGTVGSVSISLHPLVIMNISEHWTRLRAQEGTSQTGAPAAPYNHHISIIHLFIIRQRNNIIQ